MKYTNYKNNKNNPLSLLKTKVNELDKDSIIDTNYQSLRSAVNSETLKPGRFYKITDYRTSHIIPNTTDLNDSFPGRKAQAYISFEDEFALAGGTTVDLEIDGVSVASFELGTGDPTDDYYAGLPGLVDVINSAGIGYTASVVNTGEGGGGTFNEFTLKADNLGSEYEGVAELVWSSTISTKSAPIVGADPITIPVEPIIVQAVSSSELSPIAYSTLHPKDIIFYDIDSSRWGSLEAPTSKGFIYRRIDTEKNIDICFDFRGCVFRRWAVDFSSFNSLSKAYSLWTTEDIVLGKDDDSSNLYSTYTWTPISATNYQDFFIIGDYENSNDVFIREVRTAGNVIPNLVFKKTVKDTEIKSADHATIEGTVEGWRVGGLDKVIHCYTTNSNQGTAPTDKNYFHMSDTGQLGYFAGVFLMSMEINKARDGAIVGSPFVYSRNNYNLASMVCKLQDVYEFDAVHLACAGGSPGGGGEAAFNKVNVYGAVIINISSASWFGRRSSKVWLNGINSLEIAGTWPPPCYKLDYSALGNSGNQYLMVDLEKGYSNVEADVAAVSAISLNFTTLSDSTPVAGVWNMTGSGTVQINTININRGTLTNLSENPFFKIYLVPQAGLTLSIPTNNVNYGFLNSVTATADGSLGEKILLEKIPFSRRWRATKV